MIAGISAKFPWHTTTRIKKTAIMTDLIAVAVLASTDCKPILPNTATRVDSRDVPFLSTFHCHSAGTFFKPCP